MDESISFGGRGRRIDAECPLRAMELRSRRRLEPF